MFTERYNEDNLGGKEIKIKIKKVDRKKKTRKTLSKE